MVIFLSLGWVAVSIKKQADTVFGMVEDDGIGFDLAEVLTREGHGKGLGLAAMDERVRSMGGSLPPHYERARRRYKN